MDIILIPGLWLDDRTWEAVTLREAEAAYDIQADEAGAAETDVTQW